MIVGKAEAPRSYIVETQSGKARRNRHQLNVMPSLDGKTLEPPGPELEQALPESQLEQGNDCQERGTITHLPHVES